MKQAIIFPALLAIFLWVTDGSSQETTALLPAPLITSEPGYVTPYERVIITGFTDPFSVVVAKNEDDPYGISTSAWDNGLFLAWANLSHLGTNHIQIYLVDRSSFDGVPISEIANITILRTPYVDSDIDGTPDSIDTCPNVFNTEQTETCPRIPLVQRGAPLDVTGDGLSDSILRRYINGVWGFIAGSPYDEMIPLGHERSEPAVGDYDGDRKTDLGIVDVAGNRVRWTAQFADRTRWKESFGQPGDTIVTGCQFNRTAASDMAYVRGKELFVKSMKTPGIRRVSLAQFDRLTVIGCLDIDGDGVDEIAINGSRLNDTGPQNERKNIFLVDMSGVIQFSKRATGVRAVFKGDWFEDGKYEVALYRKIGQNNYDISFNDAATGSEIGKTYPSAFTVVTEYTSLVPGYTSRIARGLRSVNPYYDWDYLNFVPAVRIFRTKAIS